MGSRAAFVFVVFIIEVSKSSPWGGGPAASSDAQKISEPEKMIFFFQFWAEGKNEVDGWSTARCKLLC